MREYFSFTYKNATYKIHCRKPAEAVRVIRRQRLLLERYIIRNPEFLTSFDPVPCGKDAAPIIRAMCEAGFKAGTGPMAAVAGAIAQIAAETVAGEDDEVIIDNGGDVYLILQSPAVVALYTGKNKSNPGIGLRINPDMTPLAVCSSSSRMGHSASLGNCDLVTVVARDASLADACATAACNMIKGPDDLGKISFFLEKIGSLEGIIAITDGMTALSGKLPPIVNVEDDKLDEKITSFPGVTPGNFFSAL